MLKTLAQAAGPIPARSLDLDSVKKDYRSLDRARLDSLPDVRLVFHEVFSVRDPSLPAVESITSACIKLAAAIW